MNILIVDDDPISRKLLRAQLEAAGHTVTDASSAREALVVLGQAAPDLLITDIGMPEMSGYDLCMSLRASERLAQLPVILYTATASGIGAKMQASQAGADRFVKKPQSLGSLITIIDDVVSRRHEHPDR